MEVARDKGIEHVLTKLEKHLKDQGAIPENCEVDFWLNSINLRQDTHEVC